MVPILSLSANLIINAKVDGSTLIYTRYICYNMTLALSLYTSDSHLDETHVGPSFVLEKHTFIFSLIILGAI